MNILIVVSVFIFTILLIEGSYLFFKRVKNPELKGIQKRLRLLASEGYDTETIISLLRKRSLSDVPWLNRLLLKIPLMHRIDRMLEQSGSRYPIGLFVLISFLLIFVGYLLLSLLRANIVISVMGMLVLGSLPFLYINIKKRRRMEKFQEQLPEAMELVARALKAGQAFSGGLKMVADESGDPIGTEFSKILDELNFGVGVPDALKNLAKRIDCPDLKFFVISVLIQRESGGNLAEILENISYLIRERFKLHGRVRTLAAEGKISAYVLIAIPFLLATYMYLVQPNYITLLITDTIGRIMLGSAFLMMVIGIFVMRKMILFRV
ncbi:MAG TPA: type II secretion system F family protein [Thermodesulfobacteriota bacterium]|nr:type II secretion system F family protein [Thermodesulfobacteriota bacterium]